MGSVRTDGSAHSFMFLIRHRTNPDVDGEVLLLSTSGIPTCGINLSHPCLLGSVRCRVGLMRGGAYLYECDIACLV